MGAFQYAEWAWNFTGTMVVDATRLGISPDMIEHASRNSGWPTRDDPVKARGKEIS